LKQETGIEGFDLVARVGMLAPAGTPRSILEQLSNDIREVLKDQRLRNVLLRQIAEVATEVPNAYAAVIRREIADFTKVVKGAGLTPQ
jgi:tripartite-type tricarboxylate transporter receptor subunit TctC